jgi:hypothetical protein
MPDPFATALAALHRSVLAVAAIYTPPGGYPAPRIMVIRSQGSAEAGTGILLDTEQVSIMRSDVDEPADGGELALLKLDEAGSEVSRETFLIQGGARLDVEGLSWTCFLGPA